jgi:Tfp pilus assembly protein PilF
MIKLLAKRSSAGQIYLNVAKKYLSEHEWGLARHAIEIALEKGHLVDVEEGHRLRGKIYALLGHSCVPVEEI